MIDHETMTDELTEFLEERQHQLFKQKTDLYGRFKSAEAEAFWEGYVECMKDRYDFFEDKEMGQQMTEQEIIRYLKENSNKGVAFGFMPEEVKAWCRAHKHERIFQMYTSDSTSGHEWIIPKPICCRDDKVYSLYE